MNISPIRDSDVDAPAHVHATCFPRQKPSIKKAIVLFSLFFYGIFEW